HLVGIHDVVDGTHLHRYIEPATVGSEHRRTMLGAKARIVVEPGLVDAIRRVVHEWNVECHGNAETGLVASITEISVVAVPAVEHVLVKAYAFRDFAPRGEEHTVDGLHPEHQRRGDTIHGHFEMSPGRVCHDSVRV